MMKMKQIWMLMVAGVLPLWIHAQVIVLNEGFESGAIPASWTQEYGPRNAAAKTVASCPWGVEKGGVNPTGAAQGKYRAYFRNETGQTQGYVTRLVLPRMNLVNIYEPILRFSYAQVKWRTDIDTLRVLYRTDSVDTWHVLQTLAQSQPVWKRMELRLPSVSKTYQIAFEATDNLGRGIVLDSIQVRELPQCTTPFNILVTEISGGEATINWEADYDARNFRVVVDGNREFKVSSDRWNCHVDGLALGEHTVTVQALCDGENSMVSAEKVFEMPLEKPLPYKYNFNDCPQSTKAWWPNGWRFGNNAGMDAFVSNDNSQNPLDRISADKTPALLFCMDNFYINSIAAGSYQYAATPALVGAPLNTCRVSFSAGVYEFNRANYAHSIIVGVMTDALDITSFVPVDTVDIMLYKEFKTCYVDLDSYKGNGRFVAFKSDFDKENIIYIDNLEVKPHSKNDAPSNVHAIGHTSEVVMKWQGKADAYGVQLHSKELAKIVKTKQGKDSIVYFDTIIHMIKGSTCTITKMHEWTRYTARVWAEGGDTSEWVNCRTSLSYNTWPLVYDFVNRAGQMDTTNIVSDVYVCAPKGVQTFGTNNARPYCYSNDNSRNNEIYGNSKPGFGLNGNSDRWGAYEYWAVYPYMEKMDTIMMHFEYMCGSEYCNEKAQLIVGVIEDPQDLSTFHEMGRFIGTTNWTRYIIDLKNAPIKNGFVAMHWVPFGEGQPCHGWVDNVTFDERGQCDMVKDIRVDEAGLKSNQALILFTAPVDAKVKVRVSTDRNLNTNQLEYGSMCAFKTDDAKGSSVLATGLSYGTTYYVYMQSACSNDTKSLWTNPYEFTTPCSPLTIPYTEGFEDWGTGYYYRPDCWYGLNANATPQTAIGTSLAHSGSKYMILESRSAGDTASLVLPAIEEGIRSVRVRFYARTYDAGTALYMGVLTNPEDYTTYQELAVARSKDKNYNLYEFTFTGYTGKGKYLSIMARTDSTDEAKWLIDDLEIITLECIQPFDVQLIEKTANSIHTTWQGASQAGWQVIVADAAIDPANPDPAHVVKNETAMEPSYVANGLNVQTTYYFYYRPNCAGTAWTDTAFMTECRPLVLSQTYDFEDQTAWSKEYSVPEEAHIECWTMMNNSDNKRSGADVPFVFESSKYATSGTHCLYMRAINGEDKYSWIALPYVPVEDMTLVTVTFSAVHDYTYDWMNIEVGVMTDPEDMSTFVQCGRVTVTKTKTLYKVNLENYSGEGKYVALRMVGSAYPCYVDDITISKAACKNIHPTVDKITAKSARVKSNFSNNTNWIVRLSSEEGFYQQTIVKMGTQVSLSGLPAHTELKMLTASICSISGTDTVFGDWDEQYFMTICEDVLVSETTLEDFESMKGREKSRDEYYDIPCWQVGNRKSTSSQPYVLSMKSTELPSSYLAKNENSTHSGNNCLVFYAASASSDGMWAAMPRLAEDVMNVQVTFWARGTANFGSNKLMIGITTDLKDEASFEPIDTIVVDKKDYTKFIVRFNNYKGDYNGDYGRYVTFMSKFEDDNLIYIDDVELSYIPNCAEPTNVHVVETGDTQTKIAWNGNAAQYRVMVCDSAIADADWENNTRYLKNETISVNNYSVQTADLRHYYVYVKAICGAEGSWNIKGVDFAPECGARWTVPAIQSFEDSKNLPDCWRVIGTYSNNTIQVNTTMGRTGTNAVEIHNYAYSGTTATGLVLPLMSLEPGDCKIKFYANKGTQTTNTVYLTLVSDPEAVKVDSLAKMSPLFQQVVYESEWQEINFDISSLDPEQVANKPYVVLYTKTSNSSKNLYIDDIEVILMPSCRAPRKLEAKMVNATSAEVTITPFRSYNTKWEIAVVDTLTKTQTTTTTTTTTATITGLTTNHIYALSARTVCSASEYSEWIDTIYLHTIVVPTGLQAEATDTTVTLTWDAYDPIKWNVYVDTVFILPGEVEEHLDKFVHIERNIAGTQYVFKAEEDKKYYFLLQSADMGDSKDTYVYTSATTLKHVYTPTDLKVNDVTESSVSISWKDQSVKSNKIEISEQEDFSTLVYSTTVNGVQTFTYSSLDANTTYYVRVAQVNGSWPQSEWASTSFTTRCALAAIPFEYGFEEATLPSCWKIVSNRSGYPKIITTAGYHSEGNQSLDFYATGAAQYPQAIVLQGLDANLSECLLRFKARCHKDAGVVPYGEATMYVALTNDPNKLTVDNLTSLDIIARIAISGKTFKQYEADFTILDPLTIKDKPYIVLYINEQCRVYMDELVVKESDKCRKPMQLRAKEVTGTTATLTFDQAKPSGTWRYAVCSDEAMSDTIARGTTNSQTFTVTGLNSATTYYARVRQICSEDNVSDASETTAFTTMLAPYYEELFHTDTVPGTWTKTSGQADSIFAGKPFEEYLNNWDIQDNNIAIAGKHIGYWFNSNWHQSWLLSPKISLAKTDSAILSFDVAITCHNNQMPFEYQDKIELLCVISDDGGKTWKRENATTIAELNTNAERRAIDMTPYKGKIIQIGFYAGMKTGDIVSADFHLGNLRINRYTVDLAEVTVCEFEDIIFEEAGIFIEGGTYPPGDHSDYVLIPAADPQGGLVKDVMQKFTAHVLASPESEHYDVMCEGSVYEGYGFTNILTPGTYKRKLIAANGCDSLSVLHISEKPASYTYLNGTIYQGQSYSMLGKQYTKTGVYTDTTRSANGCDSIVTLALTVITSVTHEFDAETCEGTPYVWNGVDCTFSGKYVQIFKTAQQLDSIVTLNLTVHPLKWDTIYDTFVPGTTYNRYNFTETTPGEYRHTDPASVTGCDSTTVLYLMAVTKLNELYQRSGSNKILDKEKVIIIRDGKKYSILGEIIP